MDVDGDRVSLHLATVTAADPVTVKIDGDTSTDVPVISLTGQAPSVDDRVVVDVRGAGRRPLLIACTSGPGGSSSSSLTSLAGQLASNSASVGTGSTTTIFTTSSLAPGTWLVTAGVVFTTSSATGAVCALEVASGTATIAGQASCVAFVNGAYNGGGNVACIVTVTATATLTFKAQAVSGTLTAVASNPTRSTPNATGWTAVKIA